MDRVSCQNSRVRYKIRCPRERRDHLLMKAILVTHDEGSLKLVRSTNQGGRPNLILLRCCGLRVIGIYGSLGIDAAHTHLDREEEGTFFGFGSPSVFF